VKVILDGTDNKPFDEVRDMRVLLVYQSAAHALRTTAMLERVGQAAGEGGRLIFTPWDFDSLAVMPLMHIAVEDARNSDIIVFAAEEGELLPQQVRNWISCWLGAKFGHPRALVANLQPRPEPTLAPPVPYLAKVAEQGKMHFFSGTNESLAHVDMDLVRVAHPVTSRTVTVRSSTQPEPATETQIPVSILSDNLVPQEHRRRQTAASIPVQKQGAGKE
jgi:hypothetical protein